METLSEKTCRCGVELPPKRKKYCTDKCRKSFHYQDNKANYAKRFKDYYRTRVEALAKIKQDAGCAHCGYNAHHAALEFNHLDPSKKLGNIAEHVTNWSWEKILDEVAKCEVLCSNCHHIHSYETHYTRLGNTRT